LPYFSRFHSGDRDPLCGDFIHLAVVHPAARRSAGRRRRRRTCTRPETARAGGSRIWSESEADRKTELAPILCRARSITPEKR
jgi:hypothetical protein